MEVVVGSVISVVAVLVVVEERLALLTWWLLMILSSIDTALLTLLLLLFGCWLLSLFERCLLSPSLLGYGSTFWRFGGIVVIITLEEVIIC